MARGKRQEVAGKREPAEKEVVEKKVGPADGKREPLGKSLAQLQAEEIASRRFADMLASAGVGDRRMALEVLYFLPRAFVDVYAEMFHRAFGGKDDGGVSARGSAQAESAAVGKARVSSAAAEKTGGGAKSAGGKTFKRHWTIADEDMSRLKEKIDKRLRGIAREIRMELDGLEAEAEAEGGSGSGRARCGTCRGLTGAGWRFCATCGHNLEER